MFLATDLNLDSSSGRRCESWPGSHTLQSSNESDMLTAVIHSAGQIESGSKSEPLQRFDSNDPLAWIIGAET